MYTELLFHDIWACIELGGEHLIQVQYCQHTLFIAVIWNKSKQSKFI